MTDAVRQYESAREREMARARKIKALQRSWVDGSELTPAQLEERHRRLKAEFLERESRRRAA